MPLAWYNDNDPFVCQWARNLIAAGLIPRGRVAERSIHDIRYRDVRGYTQVHLFAGIAGWAHALRLAGWPEDQPCWTLSCPCQPFSAAGKRKGTDDDRHLWPQAFRLIRECHPDTILGEQVSSPDGLAWFDAVSTDLEREGYAVAALDTCAAGVGAPHLRQRLYFVAFAGGERLEGQRLRLQSGRPQPAVPEVGRGGEAGVVAHSLPTGRSEGRPWAGDGSSAGGGGTGRMAYSNEGQRRRLADGQGCRPYRETPGREQGYGEPEPSSYVGHTSSKGLSRRPGECGDDGTERPTAERAGGATNGFWDDAEWIPCRDGKARAVKPGTFPLAHGVSGRMALVLPGQEASASVQETHYYSRIGALRGIGNALCIPQATAFVRAVMAVLKDCIHFT